MKQSSKHHYVPQWYQKRFLLDGQSAYFALDLSPEVITKPDGTQIEKGKILTKGPAKLFYEVDLYTTNFFGRSNDDIERLLFGKIDTEGAAAVAALTHPNWMTELRNKIIDFYEYMDAQWLRTPKGLRWLMQYTKANDQNDLLFKMQKIRRLHCTMWAEASMEIVGANNSDTKFIVSDSPITFYNSVFYPGHPKCKFPSEPHMALKGTRTIFPLDLNHCAILTHIEFARSPGKFKADQVRTNPRLFDDTLINYSKIIKDRELNEQQVLAINYILKKRATKYIAAAQKDWLFPERQLKKMDWGSFDKIFQSKSTNLLGVGGEIFIGGKNGSLIATQDEFGRKPKNKAEWDEKQKQAKAMYDHFQKLMRREIL
ncbi:DUF4238 domain-containing protein [Rheinheimera sp. F8]|uniref:DUF4238 domain-containing protein n=1 Tax=Rheinheimera sp. F8 TaxID=1763998 RepID=UPI000B173254|nr:DUF4238 domain-containing protein [Rheinheimera sp. F8]